MNWVPYSTATLILFVCDKTKKKKKNKKKKNKKKKKTN